MKSNPKLRQVVFDRATPFDSAYAICEECGQEVATEFHHSIGGNGKRVQCESVESCYALGNRCHGLIESKYGHDLRMKLILKTQQRYFDKGMTIEEVREAMGGKIYKEGD